MTHHFGNEILERNTLRCVVFFILNEFWMECECECSWYIFRIIYGEFFSWIMKYVLNSTKILILFLFKILFTAALARELSPNLSICSDVTSLTWVAKYRFSSHFSMFLRDLGFTEKGLQIIQCFFFSSMLLQPCMLYDRWVPSSQDHILVLNISI